MANLPEQNPLTQPEVVAEWNGSRIVAESWDGLENIGNADSRTILIKDAGFDPPISQLVVAAERHRSEVRSYHADIDIASIGDNAWKGFLDYLSTAESGFTKIDEDNSLLANDKMNNLYYFQTPDKSWLWIEFNADVPHVTLRVALQSSEAATADQVQETQLQFLSMVMRTMDFVAGMGDQVPSAHRLARTYVLDGGKSPEKPAPQALPLPGALALRNLVSVRKAADGTVNKPEALPPQPVETEEQKSDRLGFKDIGGMNDVKAALREMVLLRKFPEIREKWGVTAARGVLLYGPSGNGKTMLITALANELNAVLISVKGSEIIDKWVGNSEKNLSYKFDQAEQADGPVVLFFDEADTILAADSSGERSSVVGAYKRRAAELSPNVVLALATNHRDKLDPAIYASSRLDLQFYVGDPDRATRADIVAQQVDLEFDLDAMLDEQLAHPRPRRSFQVFDSDLDILVIAEETHDFNGAALAAIFKNLRRQKAMQEAGQRAIGVAEADIQVAPITQADVLQEIKEMRRRGQTR